MSNNEKALKEKIVREFLKQGFKRNDIGNLEIVFTQGSDEPHILFLIPVHIKDVMDDFVKHSTPLRIEVGEDWKGFAPKKQFDGIQDYFDARNSHNEAYLKHIEQNCIPPVAAKQNVAPIQLQHKLPEKWNDFPGVGVAIDAKMWKALVEIQNIVLKLMEAQQEKNK